MTKSKTMSKFAFFLLFGVMAFACSMLQAETLPDTVVRYQLAVESGYGSGVYAPGEHISISTDILGIAYTFDAWNAEPNVGCFDDPRALQTVFTMPDTDVRIRPRIAPKTPFARELLHFAALEPRAEQRLYQHVHYPETQSGCAAFYVRDPMPDSAILLLAHCENITFSLRRVDESLYHLSYDIHASIRTCTAHVQFALYDTTHASFLDLELTINVDPPITRRTLTVENGTPECCELVPGDTVILQANLPQEGYAFWAWKRGSAVISVWPRFVFTMPDTAVFLTAQYIKLPETPAPDTRFFLTAAGTFEAIHLRWKHDPSSRSYQILRDQHVIAVVRATAVDTEGMLYYRDDDMRLRDAVSYAYSVRAVQSGAESTHPVTAQLESRTIMVVPLASGIVLPLSVDSVAADNAVTRFERPSIAGYYDDSARPGKMKKIVLITEKRRTSDAAIRLFCKNNLPLFNQKRYNARTVLSDVYKQSEVFETGQQDSIRLYLRVKKADAAHKKELRLFVTALMLPPQIQEITCENVSVLRDRKLGLKLDSDSARTLVLRGRYFGIKRPQAWIECKEKGKIRKYSVGTRDVFPEKDPLTRSRTTVANKSACGVVISAGTAQRIRRSGATKGSFVLSTGKSFDAVELEIAP